MLAHDASKHGELVWRELMTSDSAAAFQFYSEIFGWNLHREVEMGPMGVYRLFGLNGVDI